MVVVGAGLSGLIAVYRLQQSGVRVTVLERSTRAGGRFAVEVLEGLVYHPSCPVLPTQAPTLFGVLRELDCADRVSRHRLTRFRLQTRCGVRRVRTRGAGPQTPNTAWRRARVLRVQSDFDALLRRGRPELATRLDDRSVTQFLSLYLGRRQAAISGALLEAGFGLDPGETTRQLLMSQLDGWCDFAPAKVFGLGPFFRALPEQLDTLRTEASVRSVRPDGRAVELASGGSIECDAVLLAVPAYAALELLPEQTPAEELALKGIRYRKRLNVVAALKRDKPLRTVLTSPHLESPLAGVSDITPENAPAGNELRLVMLLSRPDFARELWHDSDVNLCNTLLNRFASARSELRKSVRSLAVHRLDAESPTYDVGHFRAIARLTRSLDQRFQRRRVRLCGDYLISPDLEGCTIAATRAAESLGQFFSPVQ